MGVKRILERLVRGLKMPEMLKLVTVFPLSWFFTVIAETRRFGVSLRGLHFRELKIKNLVVFLLGDSSRIRVS